MNLHSSSSRLGLLAAIATVCCLTPSTGAADPKDATLDRVLRLFVSEFVAIVPGQGSFPATFPMGSTAEASEKPVHEVKLAQPFALAKYEVTQELYEAVMGQNPSRWRGPRNSVERVSWSEANEFCRKITAELRRRKLIKADEVIRLPSEAEWEYACRTGTTTRFSFGDKDDDLKDHGWYQGNAKGEDPPVGKKKPNPWGLYDMHGYIWEWCLDAWHPDYEGATKDGKPRSAAAAKAHVIRGGAWTEKADRCRSAARRSAGTDLRSDAVGFRCVRARE